MVHQVTAGPLQRRALVSGQPQRLVLVFQPVDPVAKLAQGLPVDEGLFAKKFGNGPLPATLRVVGPSVGGKVETGGQWDRAQGSLEQRVVQITVNLLGKPRAELQ